MSEVDNYVPIFSADYLVRDINNEKIAKDITEGSKVFGDPEKLALRAAAARQGLRADRQHRLNERYYTDAYGSKLFHDAMDGNIVTGDPAALKSRAAAAQQFIRAAEYVRQLRDANTAKANADANAAKTQANAYDPSIRLNNNVQYVINTLKTYGYPQRVLDSFKQDIGKILANTKDNNRIDTANQYIDQFLGNKQDLRRLDPAPGKPALDQQPQKEELGGDTTGNGTYASAGVAKGGTKTIGYGYDPNPGTDVTDAVIKAVKADGNTSFANWRQSLVNQGWDGDPSKIKYDPSTGKFMYNVSGQAVKSAGKPRKVRQGRSSGNLSRSGGNTYATADIPKGGVVSPATMMRTSGVPPVQAAYGMNAPMGEGVDYTLTYDPMSNSMKPNDPYSYYDPSRNEGNEFTYDPITHQLVPGD